jgi:Icc-related predicted phosphoesterase
MLIAHQSDHHGCLLETPESNICINTGDFLPDSQFQTWDFNKLVQKQYDWVKDNLDRIKKYIGNRPFFYCPGNHSRLPSSRFINLLKSAGIEAYDLTNKIVKYKNLTLYGFPYVNFIDGSMNYELRMPEMSVEIEKLKKILIENKIDILACHSPPHSIMDQERIDGEHYGISELTNLLYYDTEINLPKAILFGHIHSPLNNIRIQTITINNQDILFSNAATTVNMLHLDL